MWVNTAFRHLLLAFSIWCFFGHGFLQWTPAFFIRSYGLQTGELGAWFGLVYGVAGGLGVYLGGELAARHAANNERLQLIGCALVFAFLTVFKACAYLAPHHYLNLAALAFSTFLGNLTHSPTFATIQTLVPPHMRAIAIALVYLFANLIGMGLGPLAAGMLSDALSPWLAEESLRYALVIMSPGYFWVAWHLWRASRTVLGELQGTAAHGDLQTSDAAAEGHSPHRIDVGVGR